MHFQVSSSLLVCQMHLFCLVKFFYVFPLLFDEHGVRIVTPFSLIIALPCVWHCFFFAKDVFDIASCKALCFLILSISLDLCYTFVFVGTTWLILDPDFCGSSLSFVWHYWLVHLILVQYLECCIVVDTLKITMVRVIGII